VDATLFPVIRNLLAANLPAPQEVPSYLWQSWRVWILALPAIALSSTLPLFRFYRMNARARLQGLS
jgi:hypothetical protein